MATYNKFQNFVEDLGKGVHQLHAAGHQLVVYLSNAAPSASAHAVKADLAEITNENGYTAPVDVQNDYTETGGIGTLTGVSIKIIASGGTIGPFQRIVLDNDTPTSPVDPLIAWWDYPLPLTLQPDEDIDIKFNNAAVGNPGTIFTLT